MEDNRYINFSPEGRLFQIEYCLEAVKLGTTIIGIKNKRSAILIAENNKEKALKEEKDLSKIIVFNEKIGIAISGLTSDARFLIEKTLIFLENNFFIFNSTPSIENCANKIRNFIIFPHFEENKNSYGNRPFAIAFLMTGIDFSTINLYHIKTTGESIVEEICSLGRGYKDANFIVIEGFRKKMSS